MANTRKNPGHSNAVKKGPRVTGVHSRSSAAPVTARKPLGVSAVLAEAERFSKSWSSGGKARPVSVASSTLSKNTERVLSREVSRDRANVKSPVGANIVTQLDQWEAKNRMERQISNEHSELT